HRCHEVHRADWCWSRLKPPPPQPMRPQPFLRAGGEQNRTLRLSPPLREGGAEQQIGWGEQREPQHRPLPQARQPTLATWRTLGFALLTPTYATPALLREREREQSRTPRFSPSPAG